MTTLKLWHGGHRFEGRPVIKPLRAGKFEHGPGVYSTTRLTTAARYAKGGGRVVRFDVVPGFTLLADVRIPIGKIEDFLSSASHVRSKRKLWGEIEHWTERNADRYKDGAIPAICPVNFAIEHNSLSGQGGIEFAEFLVDCGVQAHLDSRSNEDWLVIVDPKIIETHEVMSAQDLDYSEESSRTIKDQLEALASERTVRI